jgi:hypothetical protein
MKLRDNQELVKLFIGENYSYYVSVVKWSDTHYELAVLEYDKLNRTYEIDYSYFDDVMYASSSMEVYGIIQYKIRPTYFEEIE